MAADPVPLVSYIAGIAASMAVAAGGARSFISRSRRKWTNEGAASARHAKALEDNTAAATANTDAIGKLSRKLDGFAEETRRELVSHHTRIERLEDLVDAPLRTRRGTRNDT